MKRQITKKIATKKILIVDDEDNFLSLLNRTLSKEGYQIRTINNGSKAIKILQEDAFDLALIDVRMTPTDGVSILRQMRRRKRAPVVIAVTAYPTQESLIRCLELGVYRYMIKPVDIAELKRTIRSALK